MIDVLEQIILGLAYWFATATIMLPIIAILWSFVKLFLETTESWKRT